MNTKFLIVVLILFVPVVLIAQKQKPAKHKIVIQFNDPDSVSQMRSVLQVENVRKIWADAEIEVVCLGGGLDMLTTKNSKVSKQVADWTLKGITFAACNNTMNVRGIKKEDLLPQAVVVPAAVIELATKQEEGWSYFKGGK